MDGRSLGRIAVGLAYTYVGLVLFLFILLINAALRLLSERSAKA